MSSATKRLEAQNAVGRVLAEGRSLEEAAGDLLRLLCQGLGFDVGVCWTLSNAGGFTCVDAWKAPEVKARGFLALTQRDNPAPGLDLPDQVASAGAPQALATDGAGAPPRLQMAATEGLLYAIGFPIPIGAEVVGVLEFLRRTMDPADEGLLSVMQTICAQLGQALDRQRVEKALRDSEAVYHSLVESLPQNIFRKDLAGRVTFGNERYCATLKRSLDQLLGKTDFDLFPAELAAKYVQDDRRVLETGMTLETVEEHHLPDGTRLFVQVMKTPVYDAQGQIIGTQGIFWDVTERQRAAELLASSERRYRQLTEATLDAIVLADAQQRILLFNPAAERMFGYEAAEMVGQPAELLIPADYRTLHHRGFARYLQTRQARIIGQTVEMQGLRKDGTEFPVELALSVVSPSTPDSPAQALQFLAAFRDLSERNKMRAVVVQNEKLASIGLLSAGVAHEINNPLAFVANNLAVLQRDFKGFLELFELYASVGDRLAEIAPAAKARIEELAEEIDLAYVRDNLPRLIERTRDGVDRVTRIVHSLGGLARTDAPRRQEIHLPDLVEATLEILHGRFKRSCIVVEQDHDPNPRVLGVSTQVHQILLNLLMNALQAVEGFRKEGGQVVVRTRRLADDFLIEVTDNGCGIAGDHLSRLFDPFFTTKDVGEGTGLGLSITHNIVAGHGGRIQVDSQPGQGASFRVYLPLNPSR